MPKIFIDAGHFDGDSGATYCNAGSCSLQENNLTKELRDELVKEVDCISVPDNLNLRKSIDWVKERCSKEDIAISLHFNKNNSSFLHGVEAYYYDNSRLAEIFSRRVAQALGRFNRGPKPDTATYVGELGWLRQLPCNSVLLETCFLSNKNDMESYVPSKAVTGIVNALKEAGFSPEPIKKAEPQTPTKTETEQINHLLWLLSELQKLLTKITMIHKFKGTFGAASDEYPSFLASSLNPKAVSLRVKAIFSTIIPIAAAVIPLFLPEFDVDVLNQLADAVEKAVFWGGTVVSIGMYIIGHVRAR